MIETNATYPKHEPATDQEIARVVDQAIIHGLNATWDRDTIMPMAARIEQDRATIARKDEEILKAFKLGMEQSAQAYRTAIAQRDAANAEVRRLQNKCKAEGKAR